MQGNGLVSKLSLATWNNGDQVGAGAVKPPI
jgi:hypothetical protein